MAFSSKRGVQRQRPLGSKSSYRVTGRSNLLERTIFNTSGGLNLKHFRTSSLTIPHGPAPLGHRHLEGPRVGDGGVEIKAGDRCDTLVQMYRCIILDFFTRPAAGVATATPARSRGLVG